jgi:virginiamycin A acetyltransferase
MPTSFADADQLYPVTLPDGTLHRGTVFLKPAIDHPRLVIGDYTYASAHHPPQDWAVHLAPYLYPFSPEYLRIGRFCQIASGVQIITASANHRHDGFSSFPFAIFGDGDSAGRPSMPGPGKDTVIGHDVWLGTGALVLPSARIGNGVIVGAGAVVTGDVPPYAIVAGNPARLVRMRFSADVIARLERLKWWDWPIAQILAAEAEICGGDIDALEAMGPTD